MRRKIVVSLARRNLHVRYGSNTGHGFAAETQRRNGKDIFDRTDFARAMTDDALMGIFRTHAAAVVGDPHIRLAAIGDFHFNGMGTGINGIFYQFLDARRRPFDDFAGSDLIARRFI